ncbi:MAG: single-stranded-DNA-specific exonuclease RecJ [Planctomycetota bacterium]|jgi:single-stranded-DNA-specific exonuclease|nr:single-stranded-DNA-specific exonuclease RecJ [Planctomycetota bacterium]
MSAAARYRWNLLPADRQQAALIARECGVSSLMATLLAQRAGDVKGAKKFLAPNMLDFHPPAAMKDLPLAAERLARAVRDKEKIIIHGDYDADGVTATAIMVTVLRALDADVAPYLPHRAAEGYGISPAFVEKAVAAGATLVVTVDCGVGEYARVAQMQQAGIDVIITDHHESGDKALPPAVAVLNPKRSATYPFRDLVGAGVAFKLAWGLCEQISGGKKVGEKLQDALLRALPLAMIGTVADVAALTGENRVLVYHGLKRLPFASVGLRALFAVGGVGLRGATCRDIGFVVAPRLNAAGRLGAADLALEVLLATDAERARELAEILDQKNSERRRRCDEMMTQISATLTADDTLAGAASAGALVIAGENWHEGIIGIAAGRLAERRRLPCAVISLNGDVGKGSARSAAGVNLYAALDDSRELLSAFGGHAQAAGFSVKRENLPAFREKFARHCAAQAAATGGLPPLNIDGEISLTEINDYLMREIANLEPFGDRNPPPLFLCRKIRVTGTPRLSGREPRQYFKFNAVQNNVAYQAVVRQPPELLTAWLTALDRQPRQPWDLVFSLKYNAYYDPPRPELMIQDMRPSDWGENS